MKYGLVILACFAMSAAFCQKAANFCDKKWVVEKYQEVSGESFPPPKEAKNDYLIYHCDGVFESLEASVIVKGKWVLDDKSDIVTVTQTQTKNYPSKVITKIKKMTSEKMVIESKDAGGEKLTLFLKVQH